jgi:hypothetical protein
MSNVANLPQLDESFVFKILWYLPVRWYLRRILAATERAITQPNASSDTRVLLEIELAKIFYLLKDEKGEEAAYSRATILIGTTQPITVVRFYTSLAVYRRRHGSCSDARYYFRTALGIANKHGDMAREIRKIMRLVRKMKK